MVGAGKSKGGKGKGPGEAHAMQSGWTAWTAWTAYAAYEQSKATMPQTGASLGKGGTGESTKRVPRLAAEIAGAIGDLVEGKFTQDDFWEVFEKFCWDKGYPSSGFATVWFLLQRWRVIGRANKDKFKLLSLTQSNFKTRTPTDALGALDGTRPKLLAQELASPVPEYPLPQKLQALTAMDVYKMQAAVLKLLESEGMKPGQMERCYQDYQHFLLYVEELQMKFDIALYDLEVEERLEYVKNVGLYKIWVPGLAEKRPSILRGDTVLLTCQQQGKFRGYVHELRLDQIQVSFHERTPLRSMHRAVDDLHFPVDATTHIVRPVPRAHPQLNPKQTEFFAAVTAGAGSGVFGGDTGWYAAVINYIRTHTIHTVFQSQKHAKILVGPAGQLLFLTADGSIFNTFCQAGYFVIPSVEELQGFQIVVCTCTTASYIRSRLKQGQKGWFTHIFVDEAAQSVEAEALVPITLRKGPQTMVCLAGDFKQLGPVIRSPVAIEYGLQTSLMERLVNKITVDHSRVFPLLDTYRAHPSILCLYNKLVYANVLNCRCGQESYCMTTWPECPVSGKSRHPLIFHHCNGQESRQRNSPSWENVQEGSIVKQYLMKLMEHGVKQEDIGIISPYHKQCTRLRYICQGEGLDIQVGTTELFQGQEKKVIIISTVRSRQEQEIKSDIRFSLGFLGNYKRTNVAISRAKSLLIVVGSSTP
ncbi:mov10b.1 [Symbiodinium natans]|uniref:RNA helicase n=1 Tax=Symbiodinium natans TaxID=878477 RepID=A0A812H3X5_9DINO|nr:mov10b.1 [Symbiodinium natans]